MMIDTSPWSSCPRWSPWLPCSGHTTSSTGPSVSPFGDFFNTAFPLKSFCELTPNTGDPQDECEEGRLAGQTEDLGATCYLLLASCYLPSFLQEHTGPAQCNVCTRLTKDQESKSIVADVPQLPGCQCGALSLTGKTNSGQITAGQDWLRFALPSTNPLHQCTGSTRTRADKLSRGGAGVVLQPTCCCTSK